MGCACCLEHADQIVASLASPRVTGPPPGSEEASEMDVLQFDIEDEQEVLARVAAIDVAKATGMVCTWVPHENSPGRRVTKVWQVSATTNAIMDLADHLVCAGIERVVLESTSDYWRPFF